MRSRFLEAFGPALLIVALSATGVAFYVRDLEHDRPAIARDLKDEFMREDAGRQWQAILARRFPPGTQDREIERALRHEGFKVDGERNLAGYWYGRRKDCVVVLEVRWRPGAGERIEDLTGRVGGGCE